MSNELIKVEVARLNVEKAVRHDGPGVSSAGDVTQNRRRSSHSK